MRAWLIRAAKLYPKVWRERYGTEFDALINEVAPKWTDVLDIAIGAIIMQFKTRAPYLLLAAGMAVVGATAALAASFFVTRTYQSSVVMRMEPRAGITNADAVGEWFRETITRAKLAKLIQQPGLDLYPGERQRQTLDDVIEQMKMAIRVQVAPSVGAFKLSFAYPDRFKARSTVNALSRASAGLTVVSPPSLPDAPLRPNRLLFAFCGLFTGLLLSVLAISLRRLKST